MLRELVGGPFVLQVARLRARRERAASVPRMLVASLAIELEVHDIDHYQRIVRSNLMVYPRTQEFFLQGIENRDSSPSPTVEALLSTLRTPAMYRNPKATVV